jgi:hypothetical protein
MQCKNCGGKDFQKSTYNYYICNGCGNILYDERFSPKKKNSFGEIYLLLIIGTAVMIVIIMILLFVTASSRKNNLGFQFALYVKRDQLIFVASYPACQRDLLFPLQKELNPLTQVLN